MQLREIYDRVARKYADNFFRELDNKPVDRALLDMFAFRIIKQGNNLEVGCGPGEISRYLKDREVNIHGLDISDNMVKEAQRLNPDIQFVQGDVLSLPFDNEAIDSMVAFYLIVHFNVYQVKLAFAEMHRVLRKNGHILISFHVGEQTIHIEEFLQEKVDVDFMFFTPEEIMNYLEISGFCVDDVVVRYPYKDIEYGSKRCYIFAHKE